MKVVFMGTPEFARVVLGHLCESSHQVVAVVSGCDQPSGRGRRLLPTACRIEAEKRNLPVYTPKSLGDNELYQSLKELEADIFAVCAFRILPRRLFELPARGSINIHASLLPKYRGAAPINWAIINGERSTGLSSFFLKKSVDTGDVICQEEISIGDDDTYDSLSYRMSRQAGPFLVRTLDLIESDDYTPIPQDNSLATRAPKITPFDAMIDFGFPAANVRNFVRGMATKPGAYTTFRGKKLKIHACAAGLQPGEPGRRPGTVLAVKKKLIVQCDSSTVELLRVVPEGKKEMDGQSFINGHRLHVGEVLGDMTREDKEQK
ncbi:MAG: methionyl-tRNA formyltransferase [Candidatus Zixiibacteriota bacterium]|nr:MAG: methionyl-tRNA formyltransferase [candidate division Zixibacteria bacterium]